ncbi:hypothetical protein F5148DRAFT_985543 [Russula earlei]|uniref:Uncharacterized protein n=1 Tax=Russula earlei TaxID=71964 RepID=A0ACC0TZZ9_9AGAM|nr:hypothetical protein F5148DRAFT_985543 [Russula earlei]
MLPSKIIPEVSNKKGRMHVLKPKIKTKSMPAPPRKKVGTCSVEVEEIDDTDSPCWTVAGSFETPNSKKVCFALHFSHFCHIAGFYRRLEM